MTVQSINYDEAVTPSKLILPDYDDAHLDHTSHKRGENEPFCTTEDDLVYSSGSFCSCASELDDMPPRNKRLELESSQDSDDSFASPRTSKRLRRHVHFSEDPPAFFTYDKPTAAEKSSMFYSNAEFQGILTLYYLEQLEERLKNSPLE